MAGSVDGKKQSSGVKGTSEEISREKGASSLDTSVCRSSTEESVRYKGSKASSAYIGSVEYFQYSCDPCNNAGDHVEAMGFCSNCEEYLCGTCYKSHSRSKISQHHILLDKDNMPKKYKFCDPCERAGGEEEVVGYCTDCGEYLCSNCFRSHSRSKISRQHVLLDKDNIPGWTDSAPISSVAKMNVSGLDAGSQQYNEEYTYIRGINIKNNEDEEDCYIVGMTLVTSTELILADFHNKSLKLVDLENYIIKDSLRLQTFPSGLTKISQDQVAVVLEDKCKIQIISVSGRLSVVQTLNTNGECLDIKYINGKLYVSFKEPLKFQILQLTGAVYKTINPDPEVLKHCTLPRYIAVSPDESMIYISDWKTNKVMSMDMNGRMKYIYQGELDGPTDITISQSGSVYLCINRQHVLYRMTSDLSDATVILGDGLVCPHPVAMCFNANMQHFYISSGSNTAKYKTNFIQVFKWT